VPVAHRSRVGHRPVPMTNDRFVRSVDIGWRSGATTPSFGHMSEVGRECVRWQMFLGRYAVNHEAAV